ncbi:hypothetical protein QWM81_02520 [Streptomyces ficellus]|uniref:DUF3618 domain-containing protein n=1 Tax=Streptomyces ficellus TaxID=1977088 RepID=A0ABT7Z0D1_9ACTN|nr:hypothetical protein [Streptomyces ficellus]MDN3292939.1 hypothetical protein [Streptomyces ficellus]
MSEAGRVQQTGQAAKEQAAAAASRTGQAAGEVAGTAAEQARVVAGEARQQAGSAVRDLRQRLTDESQAQAERLAGTVRQWADDLAGLAENAPRESPARSMAAQAADQGHRAADYLGKNGVEGLVGDLQNFARRRPGAFLGGAALAGLVVGRLAKAGKAAQSSDGARQAPGPAQAPGSAQVQPAPAPQETLPQGGAARPELPGYPGV